MNRTVAAALSSACNLSPRRNGPYVALRLAKRYTVPMDPGLKTSFIPKQSLEEQAPKRRPRTIGFFALLVIIVFFIVVGISVGVFVYRSIVKGTIKDMRTELASIRATFDPTRIEELRRLDLRIEMAKERLEAHTAPTLLFDLLQANTVVSVQYEDFKYETLEDLSAHLEMRGKARNFTSVALQSDAFGEDKNIIGPLFEELNPDESGFVNFSVDMLLDRAFLSYGNRVGFGGLETPEPEGGVLDNSKSFETLFEPMEETAEESVSVPVDETETGTATN